jgi:hypothetical protein
LWHQAYVAAPASGGNEGQRDEPLNLPPTGDLYRCHHLWNHRMFLMHADAKYLDVLERVLYNAVLSGISMKGDRFFYPNPLESGKRKKPLVWLRVLSSNVARLCPCRAMPTHGDKDIYVNLSSAAFDIPTASSNKLIRVPESYEDLRQPERHSLCMEFPGAQ